MRTIIGLLVAFLLITPAHADDGQRDTYYQKVVACAAVWGHFDAKHGENPDASITYKEDGCLPAVRNLSNARIAQGGFKKETANYAAIGTAMGAYDGAYQITLQLMKRGLLKND